MFFQDKHAVVTGGGAGIGRALALALARQGAEVAVVDAREEPAESVAREVEALGGKATSSVVDISDRASVVRFAGELGSRVGEVDLLFANAGVGAAGSLASMPEPNWRWVLAVNLEGTLHTLQELLPLVRRPGGHVTITASMAGLASGGANMGVYMASKSFLVSLGEALREELEPEGVGVHLLCPGLVATRIWNGAVARPERFGGPVSLPEEVGEHWKTQGIDAALVAERALEGIRAGDLYILVPDRDGGRDMSSRHSALAAALSR